MSIRFAFFPAVLLCALSQASAKIEYRVKNADAPLFGNPELLPPPMALLREGAALDLIRKGPASSQVRGEDGLSGWMANQDIVAMAAGDPGQHQVGEQAIRGGLDNASIVILMDRNPDIEAPAIRRSFSGDIVEFADKEQVEIRNGEN